MWTPTAKPSLCRNQCKAPLSSLQGGVEYASDAGLCQDFLGQCSFQQLEGSFGQCIEVWGYFLFSSWKTITLTKKLQYQLCKTTYIRARVKKVLLMTTFFSKIAHDCISFSSTFGKNHCMYPASLANATLAKFLAKGHTPGYQGRGVCMAFMPQVKFQRAHVFPYDMCVFTKGLRPNYAAGGWGISKSPRIYLVVGGVGLYISLIPA